DAQPSDAAVSLAFAAKEALFKAAHARVLRFIGFDEAAVAVSDDHPGAWTAALGERLAADLGVASVDGTYAWDHALVYAVIALPAPSIGS
ncbi:MAG: 4'-phosphopantetheinyl transferase superfamily protein, partial [Actinomycetota bacterium]